MSPEKRKELEQQIERLRQICRVGGLISEEMLLVVTMRSGIELAEDQLAAEGEPPLDTLALEEELRQLVADQFLLFSRTKKFATRIGADRWVRRLLDSGVASKR